MKDSLYYDNNNCPMGYELLIWAKRGELHGTAFVTL